jgi:hypothetical protein
MRCKLRRGEIFETPHAGEVGARCPESQIGSGAHHSAEVTPRDRDGDIFVVGTANVDGHEHIRMFGENTFGFGDLRADQHSDFDYNDMLVRSTTA